MDDDDASPDVTALETLTLLEERLRDLSYVLNGATGTAARVPALAHDDQTILARIATLEGELERLSSGSSVIRDILQLQARHSDLFQPSPSGQAPPTLSYPMLRQVVLACASLYATTASQLASVKDLPLPPAKASTTMITLQPRIDRVNEVQTEQLQEIARLRRRSAALIERWYKVMILAGNECWLDWERRVAQVEREVRREEVRRADDGEI